MNFKPEINMSLSINSEFDLIDFRSRLLKLIEISHHDNIININLNIIIDHNSNYFHEEIYKLISYWWKRSEFSEFNHTLIGVIIQTNFIKGGEDNLKSIHNMISQIKDTYNNLPLTSIMVSNDLDPIDLDIDVVMNLLNEKYDLPLSICLNPSSLDLNLIKALKDTCDANNYILLPAFMNAGNLLTHDELQGYVNILNINKIPFKFTIDLHNANYSNFYILSRMRFIAQILKYNGVGIIFNINSIMNLSAVVDQYMLVRDCVHEFLLHPTAGLSFGDKEDNSHTPGLSVDTTEVMNTSWVDTYFYKSLKELRYVSPYQHPPSYSVLYNLGENNRVCVDTLHLKESYKFKRKFIQARLIDDEILVIQEFFSENNHNVTVFSAWLERNPHIICIWQLNQMREIINVTNYLFNDTNIKLQEAVGDNPNKQPCCEVTSSPQSIDMNVSEHRQYILDTLRDSLENYGNIDLISDEDYDDSRSILAYREEFLSVQWHFDILLTSLTLSTINLHKDLLIELKSLWEAAIHIVSKFKVDQALPILEWLPAMWMQVIGCPDVVRSREELFFILYEILSNPKLAWTPEAIVKSLTDRKFRNKFAQWIGRHLFDHSENIERDLWDISEPIDWNSYFFIENGKVKYSHAHSTNGGFDVTASKDEINLKVVDQRELFKTIIPFDVTLRSQSVKMTFENYAENVFIRMQDILKVNGNCYFLGHCTTEESIIKMSKYGMSPYAGFGNKKSCGHGMYFFKMSKTDKTFEDLKKRPSNPPNVGKLNGDYDDNNNNDDIVKEFQGFLYAISERVKKIEDLAVMLFLIKEDVKKLIAFDTTKELLELRECKCSPAFKVNKSNDCIEYVTEPKSPTTIDTINAVSMIDSVNDVERFNIFALISGVVDFNKIPNGIFRGNIFDGLCNITKSNFFPPEAMPYWLQNQQQFGLWKNACSSLSIEKFRRKYGYFDEAGIFKICKQEIKHNSACKETFDLPIEMWEHVFVSTIALQNLLELSLEIHIVFKNSDASSSSIVPCENKSNINDYVMNKNWLNSKLNKGMPRHPYWVLCLQCPSSGLDFEKCSKTASVTLTDRDDNHEASDIDDGNKCVQSSINNDFTGASDINDWKKYCTIG